MIKNLINENLIKMGIDSNNKEDLFDELAEILFKDHRIINKEMFINDVETRESIDVTSTNGIAYPHARSKAVSSPAIAVGIKHEGIEYDDEDGINPTVFFMIASPDNNSDHHIYVLQELFGKFNDDFIENILNAENESQVLKILISKAE